MAPNPDKFWSLKICNRLQFSVEVRMKNFASEKSQTFAANSNSVISFLNHTHTSINYLTLRFIVLMLMFLMSQKPVFNFLSCFLPLTFCRLQKLRAKIPWEILWKMWKFLWNCVHKDLRKWLEFKGRVFKVKKGRHGNVERFYFRSRVDEISRIWVR